MEQTLLFPELTQPPPSHDEDFIVEAEKWISLHLGPTPHPMAWRCTWVAYSFRYWLIELGVAIDFTTSNPRDLVEDQRRWKKSGVVTLRVEPFNDESARILVEFLSRTERWWDRKKSGTHKEMTLTEYVKRREPTHHNLLIP